MKIRSLFAGLFLLCILAMAASAQTMLAGKQLTLSSAVLGEERVVLVRTPPGYEKNGQRYPVLYMTDGNAQLVHTVSTIEFLSRNGRMPEMIVVAITNTDRTRDLTPTRAAMPREEGGAPIQFPTSGGADKFLKFIETELIPKIEAEYRTQPYRIFAGHSFGGLFAINAFLTRPDAFNAYIAVSPSMHWDNGLMCRRAEAFFKEQKELPKTLYLTIADEKGDMRAEFDRFVGMLGKNKPRGFEWASAVMEDEDHGSVVLRSHYQGFRKIYDGWQIPQTVARQGVDAAEAYYKKLSDRFGYTILMPEQLMNNLGYALMTAGKMEDAIKAFKANIERYPNSANVYDSLGEAYEKSGRHALARENYQKAVEIGTKTNDPSLAVFRTNAERMEAMAKKAEK